MFDRIYSAAMAKIEKGGLAARLFHWAYSTKAARLQQNVRHDRVRALPSPCTSMWSLLHRDMTQESAWTCIQACRADGGCSRTLKAVE